MGSCVEVIVSLVCKSIKTELSAAVVGHHSVLKLAPSMLSSKQAKDRKILFATVQTTCHTESLMVQS